MAIRNEARRSDEALFPDHNSTLAVTDPELIEVFDSWAFGDLLEGRTLDPRTRLMVQLAAIIASHAVAEFRVMLGGALNIGVTPVEAKEVVYQAVPYVGMAKVSDFLQVTNEVLVQRGIALPLPGPPDRGRNTPGDPSAAIRSATVAAGTTGRVRTGGSSSHRHSIRPDLPCRSIFSGALSSPRGRAGERVPRRRGSEARGGPPAKWREAHTKRGSPVVTAQRSPGCGPGGHCEAEKPGGARLCDRVRGGKRSARADHAPTWAPAVYELQATRPGDRRNAVTPNEALDTAAHDRGLLIKHSWKASHKWFHVKAVDHVRDRRSRRRANPRAVAPRFAR
jgi:alkylhydroperoxidase/carboxymuconolactone decarboxylase family protein YurZ